MPCELLRPLLDDFHLVQGLDATHDYREVLCRTVTSYFCRTSKARGEHGVCLVMGRLASTQVGVSYTIKSFSKLYGVSFVRSIILKICALFAVSVCSCASECVGQCCQHSCIVPSVVGEVCVSRKNRRVVAASIFESIKAREIYIPSKVLFHHCYGKFNSRRRWRARK